MRETQKAICQISYPIKDYYNNNGSSIKFQERLEKYRWQGVVVILGVLGGGKDFAQFYCIVQKKRGIFLD